MIYLDAGGPIVGDLTAGTVTGHGSDTIANTEWMTRRALRRPAHGHEQQQRACGARGADQISSLDGEDLLAGGGGDDAIDGGTGFDYLDSLFFFWYPPFNPIAGPVVVDLVAGTATGQGTDTIAGIEGSSGSAADDVMTGNAQDNEFTQLFEGADTVSAGAGADLVDGGEGADALTGGTGVDTLGHLDSPAGMTVSFQGVATTSDGDSVAGFEDIVGSFYADDLTGSNVANFIAGADGDDTISGRTGDDTLIGEAGDDTAIGGGAPPTHAMRRPRRRVRRIRRRAARSGIGERTSGTA